LRALFPDGEDKPPRLKDESAQAWTLNSLANSYSLAGQPRRGVPLFLASNLLDEKSGNKKGVAIGLGNVAIQQLGIGELKAAEQNLRRSIALCREIKDEFGEAIGHQGLGRALAYRGEFAVAGQELDIGLSLFEKSKAPKDWVSKTWAYRCQLSLFRGNDHPALEAALKAMEFYERDKRETGEPVERDFIRAEWLMGAALVAGATPIPSPSPDTGEGSGVSPSLGGKGLGVRSATRAFVEAMGALGSYYHNEYEDGNRDVIGVLTAEEANLLQARALARTNGWWRRVISTMQGLDQLYDHTGRRAEWARLVAEIVPDFVDPASDGPRPGREEEWGLVTEYRVRLAMEARQWAEAERLQHAQVAWTRRRAAPALAAPPAALDAAQKNAIRTLAVSVSELGNILREQGKAECVAAYEEDYELSLRIGDQPGAAVTAFNLGHVYKNISALRDLVQAEHWYRRSLELFSAGNDPRQAQCLGQLGLVARERFKEASAAQQPEAELLHHLNAALGFYLQVLDLLPPNAVDDLAVTHNQLGNTYADAGDLDRALPHYREAIRYDERGGNLYKAGEHRRNVALALAQAGRFPDALDYAQAALRNFETYGERAAEMIEETRRLIGMIEEDLRKSGERKM